jgi:hypothetical protein
MFGGVRIGVGFQPKLQLTFRCMAVGIKPGFMAMFLSTAPSRKLTAKSKLCCNTHALFQQVS